MIDNAVQTLLAIALAALFAAAALHKLRHRTRFDAQLAEYRLLPAALLVPAARVLAGLELAAGSLLLTPPLRGYGGALAAALLITYGAAIAINLARGRSYIDCGCGDTPQLLSPWLLLRNGVLAAGAVAVAMPGTDRSLGWIDWAVVVPAFLVLLITHAAVEQLLANASALREWRDSHG
jgi:hypothetical protein